MKINSWVNTSTVVLELTEEETLANQVVTSQGDTVRPVRLTIVWTDQTGPNWGKAAWAVEASRTEGDVLTLTESDVDDVPAWITREIEDYHPNNYEG